LRAAFYVSYDANSLASLKNHYKDIDLLIPEELHAVTADGALTVVDYVRYETVKVGPQEAYGRLREDKLHQWMRSINVEIPTMAMLNNYDGAAWHMKEMVEMLTNPSARANLIRDTCNTRWNHTKRASWSNFEQMPDKNQPEYREFIGELAPALHAVGIEGDDSAAGARR